LGKGVLVLAHPIEDVVWSLFDPSGKNGAGEVAVAGAELFFEVG